MKFKLMLSVFVLAAFSILAYITCTDKRNDVLCKMAIDGSFDSKSDMSVIKDGDNALVVSAACGFYSSSSRGTTTMIIR